MTAPQGFSREAAASHPTYKYYDGHGARCELNVGHDPPHRCGLLLWYNPPLIVLGPAPELGRLESTGAVEVLER